MRTILRKKLSVAAFIVLLSLWSDTAAAMLCPHMNGKGSCQPIQKIHSHCHEMAGMSEQPIMSEMNSMDSQEGIGINSDSTRDEFASIVVVDLTQHVNIRSLLRCEALTAPPETCPHCMLHSQSQSGTLNQALRTGNTVDSLTPNIISTPVESIAANFLLFDVRDHSPPINQSTRYVLMNVFRI